LIRILCVFVILATIFSGCSNSKAPTLKNTVKPYNIIWYQINAPQKDTDKVFNEVNKYVKEKINASVTVKMVDYSEYDRFMKSAIASGEKFDLCFTSSWANNYYENSLNGKFLELSSLLKQHPKLKENIPPLQLKASKINGKSYAVPVVKPISDQISVTFNHKYVQKYGFDLSNISTLEDMEPMLSVIKEKEPDIAPYVTSYSNNHASALPFDQIIAGIPGSVNYMSSDIKVINELESKEYKAYLSLMRKWYLAGYIPVDAPSLEGIFDYEKNGKWFSSVTTNTPHHEKTLKLIYGYDVDIVPLHHQVIKNSNLTGAMLAISSTSQNPKKVMEFIDLLYTDKNLYNLIIFGIEGEHYKKVSNGQIAFKEGISYNNTSYMCSPYMVGNCRLSFVADFYPLSFIDDIIKYDSSATKSPLLGFWFDPSKVKSETANLAAISNEFLPLLNTGSVDPDIMLPKVISKLNEAGLDKVIAEEQRQIDQLNK